jgi:hypothetical protein
MRSLAGAVGVKKRRQSAQKFNKFDARIFSRGIEKPPQNVVPARKSGKRS